MYIEVLIKEYLPVITAFLGAFVAYAFANRKYRVERFHKDATESLEEFYSPVFHEMRKIKIKLSSCKEEEKISILSNFIKPYTEKDTNIFKSYNLNLIELFYDLDQVVIKPNSVDEAISIFNRLYLEIKREYNDLQKSLYKNFPWIKFLNKLNPIFRVCLDLTTLLYDIAQFLLAICFFIGYVIVFSKITGDNNVPIWVKDNMKSLIALSISLFTLALIMRFPYYLVMMNYKKENKLFKCIDEKIFKFITKLRKK